MGAAAGGEPLVVVEPAVGGCGRPALAHLLAASEGRPVTVSDGLIAEVFQRALDGLIAEVLQRALDALLPAGPPARRAVLAGPGRPAPDTGADILCMPTHPQTGEAWTPAGPAASAFPVPLLFGVWLWLAFPEPYLPVPSSGGMPDGILRDDPPLPRPGHLFRADPGAFQHTLVRQPAVRSPWLREILEDPTQQMRAGIF